MERMLTIMATVIALCITLLLPGVAFYSGYKSLGSILISESEINAHLVSALINENPELWRVVVLRLEELLGRRPGDRTPEVRSVFDTAGKLVARSSEPLDPPLIERSMPVHDAGIVVGRLTIQRSLRPLQLQTAEFALLGLLLGGAAFVTLRTLPVRALRRSQERLRHHATHDALTGLPNRMLFGDRLEQAMQRSLRGGRTLALMFVDLDRFKDVNDGLGHDMGDQLLQHTARQIVRCLEIGWSSGRRNNDCAYTVARMGGDEFTVLAESCGSMDDTAVLVQRLLAMVGEPLTVAGRTVHAQCSIGIALFPRDDVDAGQLMRDADIAMYRAKEHGGGGYQFFNEELNAATQHRIALDQALHGALERGEFLLYYQPKADLRSGEITGVEALLRWQRPDAGVVSPNEFIAALESTRLIVPVGTWVIQTVCAQLVEWNRLGLPALTVAVNLSAAQFRDHGLHDHIERALRANGIAAERLELELTESMLMDDNELSRQVLGQLSTLGVRVAIDDFGTGYSSLAYLKRFPVDTLKLDRSFVRDLPWDEENAAIARAIVALAHSLGLDVVCEGVETSAQRDFLRTLGCGSMQGYWLSEPMPAAALAAWLRPQLGEDRAQDSAPVEGEGA